MSKHILQALPELVQAGVLSPETATQIRNFYRQQESKPAPLLFIVFGILGALSVGLGIILILAHNWDALPRATKTSLAFAPLLLGQLAGGYALAKKAGQTAWRESAAAFLFLAVGASIALVGQIYHIPSQGGTFLLTWMLLGLPLVYLLGASVASLLFILGITYYAVDTQELFQGSFRSQYYWLLLAALLPHYYRLLRHKPEGNFTFFHHWLLPLSAAVALFTVGQSAHLLLVPAYVCLFGLYSQLGYSGWLAGGKKRNNGYLVLGTLGTLALLLALSFDTYWLALRQEARVFSQLLATPEFISVLLLFLLALALLVGRYRRQPLTSIRPTEISFLFFMLAFTASFLHPGVAVVLINGLVLALGLLAIRQGARSGQLGALNYGLLLVAALITCRFFDTDLSFVFRGTLFVAMGAGFFYANYWMLQKRKTHE
jgi:uncharacterized membrane protein